MVSQVCWVYHLIALAHQPPMYKARCPSCYGYDAKPFQDVVSSSDIFDAGGDTELWAFLESCRPAPILYPKQPRKRHAASEVGPGVLKKPARFSVCKRPAASDKQTAGVGCSAVVGCSTGIGGSAAGVGGSAAGAGGSAAAAAFSHEASRQQFQCRQGKGKGSTAKLN